MTKMFQYEVAPYPYKAPGFIGRILVRIGFKKAPETFTIWINDTFQKNSVITSSSGEKYVVIKQL